MTDTNMINVLIKDQSRTLNWDYYPDKRVGDILAMNGFRPIPGTVKIKQLTCANQYPSLLLSECPQEVGPDGRQMRVTITLRSFPDKRQTIKKKVEVEDDVR